LDETPNHKQKSCALAFAILFAPAADRGQEDVGGGSQVPGKTSGPDHLATQAGRALLPGSRWQPLDESDSEIDPTEAF
jgi:hypothetical protein